MNIKTWSQRIPPTSTPAVEQLAMQAEIDELRAENAAQRKVLQQVLNTLIDVTASINMKRFWRDKDGKRFDEITDTAITAIQGVLKS